MIMDTALLQRMVEGGYIYDMLPETWKMGSMASFSKQKKLFPYQLEAFKLAVNALYLYYEDLEDFSTDEDMETNELRKERLYNKYLNAGMVNRDNIDIKNLKSNDYLIEIFGEYFEPDNDRISFKNLVNRMSFWMATGSGKSLLIVKLIVLLDYLIVNEEIPDNDLLFLAPSNEIIDQFKGLVAEYNGYDLNNKKIELVSLKKFDESKQFGNIGKQQKTDFGNIRVFYYRSDNFRDLGNDGDLDAFINYRNYESDGKWYILLDEAHKGGKESSRQQAYFSIMARNGFLFNFSASFTDSSDVMTTVYDFKLKNFVMAGYGKNVYVSKYDYEPFKDNDSDFSNEEKRKIVLKSLITLCMLKKHAEKVKQIDKTFYHSPLMMTLVDSVNMEDSDLELFFKELEDIANRQYDDELFLQAKEELLQEFSIKKTYDIGEEKLKIKTDVLKSITPDDLLKYIFNSDSKLGGKLEVIVSSDNKELAFRLKSSSMTSSPFALIKIGDVNTWIREKLKGYHFVGTFENKNYFRNLDKSGDINILMGSRAFYEGWDSKRPNVLNYINIGTSINAVKYITQSLGRGVRIEPIPNKRTRLKNILQTDICISGKTREKFKSIEGYVSPLETLFVFGTNKNAIKQVINFDVDERVDTADLKLNKTEDNRLLLKPVFVSNKYKVGQIPRFRIGYEAFIYLYKYVNSMPENVLVMKYNGNISAIRLIKDFVNSAYDNIINKNMGDKIFEIHEDYYYQYKDIPRLYGRLIEHIKSGEKMFSGFIEVDESIKHYKSIKINESKYDEILEKIKEVYPRIKNKEMDLVKFIEDIKSENLPADKALKMLSKLQQKPCQQDEVGFDDDSIIIKYMPEHYYNPIIYTNKENLDYIKGVISEANEVHFLKLLGEFIKAKDKEIKERYDWWKFSVLNEHKDNVYIPYFDLNSNQRFRPGYIFWFCKGNSYRIVFVDSETSQDSKWIAKVKGFKKLFKNKKFGYNNLSVTVDLKMFGKQGRETGLYNEYWTDNIDGIFEIYKEK